MSDTLQGAPVEDFIAGPPSGPEGGNRRLLVIIAAVAGVLVVGAAAYFLFLSGGGTDEQLGAVPTAQPTGQPSQDAGQGKNGQHVPKHVQNNFKAGVDPFKPLAAEAPVVTQTDPADTSSTDTSSTDTSSTDTSSNNSSNNNSSNTGSDTPATTTYQVILTSVNANKGTAVFSVNGTDTDVAAGDNFPDSKTGPLQLIGVNGNSARIQFGSGMVVILDVGHGTTFYG